MYEFSTFLVKYNVNYACFLRKKSDTLKVRKRVYLSDINAMDENKQPLLKGKCKGLFRAEYE